MTRSTKQTPHLRWFKPSGCRVVIEKVHSLVKAEQNSGKDRISRWIERLDDGKIGPYLQIVMDENKGCLKFYCPWEKEAIAEIICH